MNRPPSELILQVDVKMAPQEFVLSFNEVNKMITTAARRFNASNKSENSSNKANDRRIIIVICTNEIISMVTTAIVF